MNTFNKILHLSFMNQKFDSSFYKWTIANRFFRMHRINGHVIDSIIASSYLTIRKKNSIPAINVLHCRNAILFVNHVTVLDFP